MGFIVFQHNDRDEEIDAKSYLSLYSLPEYSLVQSHILPIDYPGSFVGSHCKGIYFFTDLFDKFVIINLSTKEFKPLTPPPQLEPCAQIHACGIGQHPDSGVYKIVVAYHFDERSVDGHTVFQGPKNRALLYSFSTNSWTPIQCLDTFTADSDSVYIGHERYWTAMTRSNGQPHDRGLFFIQVEVVSFNFLSDSFNLFSLPEYPSDGRDYNYKLVEYGEKLGVVMYTMPHGLGSVNHCIWQRKGQEWIKVHTFCTGPVVKVLALKHEQELIFEAPCKDEYQRSEVHVVDVDGGGQPRKLNIFGQWLKLRVLPFEENEYSLPDGQPLMKSYSDDEDEKKKKKSSKY